ncbi:hypothetical protein GUJ93_ZPchr0010g9619 [Zizania palustris]|uniref:Uncharacterized protein n=1 Tax=Zizania palustris TaxID=103762 RepID=A0A8J6BP57_ZIZPA|nr:hypothetical protein GUJ93_ZPchr0010g9619 [Zizania palustris]
MPSTAMPSTYRGHPSARRLPRPPRLPLPTTVSPTPIACHRLPVIVHLPRLSRCTSPDVASLVRWWPLPAMYTPVPSACHDRIVAY